MAHTGPGVCRTLDKPGGRHHRGCVGSVDRTEPGCERSEVWIRTTLRLPPPFHTIPGCCQPASVWQPQVGPDTCERQAALSRPGPGGSLGQLAEAQVALETHDMNEPYAFIVPLKTTSAGSPKQAIPATLRL